MEHTRIKRIRQLVPIRPEDLKAGDRVVLATLEGKVFCFDIISNRFRNTILHPGTNDPQKYIGFVARLFLCSYDVEQNVKKYLNIDTDWRIEKNNSMRFYDFYEFLDFHREKSLLQRQMKIGVYHSIR